MESTKLVDSLRIASPCPAAWSRMKGDDRVRFCGTCEKHVYNIAAMSTVEVVGLIEKTEGKACVRIHLRRDGTVLTADCPVGLRSAAARRLRRLGSIAAALTGIWWINSLLQATGRWSHSTTAEPAGTATVVGDKFLRVMGKVVSSASSQGSIRMGEMAAMPSLSAEVGDSSGPACFTMGRPLPPPRQPETSAALKPPGSPP
jgi:hypothetical protein